MAYQPIDDDLTEFGRIVSQELATLIKENIDYLHASIPVGQVCPIMVNIPGVATPDPAVWQLCDGSEITHPSSPLRSTGGNTHFTPNLTDRFVRFVTTVGESGTSGGANTTTAFSHSHGGWTGEWESPEDADPSNNAQNTSITHRHTIANDLTTPINMEPEYFILKFFMKIQ